MVLRYNDRKRVSSPTRRVLFRTSRSPARRSHAHGVIRTLTWQGCGRTMSCEVPTFSTSPGDELEGSVQQSAPHSPQSHPVSTEDVAVQFAAQGMRTVPNTDLLWCTLCTTVAVRQMGTPANNSASAAADEIGHAQPTEPLRGPAAKSAGAKASGKEDSDARLLASVTIVGRTVADVMAHCGTHTHLVAYEAVQERDLSQWCRVELDGRRVLLDHHCIYPRAMYGPGRAILNRTIAGGMLLATDVCGGVKLWSRHRYEVVELVLPSADNTSTCQVRSEACTVDRTAGTGAVAPGSLARSPTTRLVHPISGLPSHLRRDESEGRHRSGWCSWRAGTRPRVRPRTTASPGATRPSWRDGPTTATTGVLPTFAHEEHGLRGEIRRQRANVPQMLQEVNDAIKGEATERARRRRRLEKHNIRGDSD